MRSPAAQTSCDEGAVIGFKVVQAGVEQLAFGNDHDVEPGRDLVATENLSDQTFCPVAADGAPELPRGRDSQPARRAVVGQDEDRAVAAVHLRALVVHALELGAPADTLVGTEVQGVERPELFARDGQTFPPFGAAALQHQAPVLGAHTHQKPVCLFAMPRIGLKSPDSLGHDIPSN